MFCYFFLPFLNRKNPAAIAAINADATTAGAINVGGAKNRF